MRGGNATALPRIGVADLANYDTSDSPRMSHPTSPVGSMSPTGAGSASPFGSRSLASSPLAASASHAFAQRTMTTPLASAVTLPGSVGCAQLGTRSTTFGSRPIASMSNAMDSVAMSFANVTAMSGTRTANMSSATSGGAPASPLNTHPAFSNNISRSKSVPLPIVPSGDSELPQISSPVRPPPFWHVAERGGVSSEPIRAKSTSALAPHNGEMQTQCPWGREANESRLIRCRGEPGSISTFQPRVMGRAVRKLLCDHGGPFTEKAQCIRRVDDEWKAVRQTTPECHRMGAPIRSILMVS